MSALSGEGLGALKVMLERFLGSSEQVFRLKLDPADGAGLAWAYAMGAFSNARTAPLGPNCALQSIHKILTGSFLITATKSCSEIQAIRQVS